MHQLQVKDRMLNYGPLALDITAWTSFFNVKHPSQLLWTSKLRVGILFYIFQCEYYSVWEWVHNQLCHTNTTVNIARAFPVKMKVCMEMGGQGKYVKLVLTVHT